MYDLNGGGRRASDRGDAVSPSGAPLSLSADIREGEIEGEKEDECGLARKPGRALSPLTPPPPAAGSIYPCHRDPGGCEQFGRS